MTTHKPYRVLVVDDHLITRSFFENTIRSSGTYELAASLALAQEAVDYCQEHPVDIVLLDVLMRSGMDGLSAAGLIKEDHPEIKIILATSAAEAKWLEEARKIGIEAFWYKDLGSIPLLTMLDRVVSGETVFLDDTTQLRIGNAFKKDFTERELDVLRELTNCATNEEIAQKLFISINTVKTHIRHMLEKTGFSDRLELAIHASKSHIVVSDEERTGK